MAPIAVSVRDSGQPRNFLPSACILAASQNKLSGSMDIAYRVCKATSPTDRFR